MSQIWIGIVTMFSLLCMFKVPPSCPNQPLLLPLLLHSASVQESLSTCDPDENYQNTDHGHDNDDDDMFMNVPPLRDEDWRIFCLKITRTRDEVGS